MTPHNIKQLKLLNQVVFPVSYNEKFYKDVLEAGELAKLAYYNDIVVRCFFTLPLVLELGYSALLSSSLFIYFHAFRLEQFAVGLTHRKTPDDCT